MTRYSIIRIVVSSALALLSVFVSGSSLHAQFKETTPCRPELSDDPSVRQLQFWNGTSSNNDAAQLPDVDDPVKPKPPGHKSPILAAGLSILLPGLGEYYVGDQIWRGVIFTGIEAGMWYGNYLYNKRGNDSLLAFHAWADSLWLPSKYVDTLNSLLTLTGSTFQIKDPNNFSQINQAEDTLDYRGVGDFTHNLPPKGSQQYYELIAKYDQFTAGWVDATSHSLTSSPDAERSAYMRANMNIQYDIAGYFVWGMILNRVLSAIDAVLLAKDHNSPLHLEGALMTRQLPGGLMTYTPTAKLRYTF